MVFAKSMLLGQHGTEESRGGYSETKIFVSTRRHDDLTAGRAEILVQKVRDGDIRTVRNTLKGKSIEL